MVFFHLNVSLYGRRIIEALLFAKHLHRFCFWFEWLAKLNSKNSLESFLSLPSIFGYLGKETKNTAEHLIMNKIFIYPRPCANEDFVHRGSIG